MRNLRLSQKVFFGVLLALYSGATLYLFVMQCYQVPDFVSDMPAYVDKVRGIQGDYEFPYPLFFVLAQILAFAMDAPAAVAVVTMLLNALGICVARYYMGRYVEELLHREKLTDRGRACLDGAVTVAAFVLFLVGNLYSPKNTSFFGFDYAYRCMGIYTANPIWNATYMATRPFAIACFFEAAILLRDYRKDFSWKKCAPFAVSLFLTTITKPSYTMVLLPLMAVMLLGHLIMSRGKSFRSAFCLCITMIPTGIALLYQYSGIFTGVNVRGEETGIGFAWAKVWHLYTKNIPLSVVMGIALPIGILVLNYKDFPKDYVFRFAWWNYIAAALMFLSLYEKGFRMDHANFSWGYMHGIFFLFCVSLVYVIKNSIQWWKTWKFMFVLAEWAVLLFHLVCGVNFLWYAIQGNELAGF